MLRPGNLEDDGADILIASARMSIAHVGYSLRADWGESGNDAQGVDLAIPARCFLSISQLATNAPYVVIRVNTGHSIISISMQGNFEFAATSGFTPTLTISGHT